MAKLSFTKLGLKKNEQIVQASYNDQIIEIKQYLPAVEKLMLITRVLELSADDNNFSNPIKRNICFGIEVVKAYTNITFTEKQSEDIAKLYDLLEGNGIIDLVKDNIPEGEYNKLKQDVVDTIEAFYKYSYSLIGMIDSLMTQYSTTNLDLQSLQEKIQDPTFDLLRQIAPLLEGAKQD